MEVKVNKNEKFYTCVSKISNMISKTEWENKVFLYGDCVRKIMMGEVPARVDICVEKNNGGETFATWLARESGNFSLYENPVHFPLSDTYSLYFKNDGRISTVEVKVRETRKMKLVSGKICYDFSTLEDDAMDREMTANALYVALPNSDIYDFLKRGANDIDDKLVKGANKDLDSLFKCNPIYMMRLIRYATTLGWDIEKNTWLAIVKNAKYILNAANYEIKSELSWICLADKPSIGIKRLLSSGLLRYIIPEVSNLTMEESVVSSGNNLFEHTLDVIDKTKKSVINRLAALLHEIGKPSTHTVVLGVHKYLSFENVGAKMAFDVLERFDFSEEVCRLVGKIIKYQTCLYKYIDSVSLSNKAVRKIMAVCGTDVDKVFDLIEADNTSRKKGLNVYNQTKSVLSRIKFLENDGREEKEDDFPINGKDIMETLHIKSSPRIGEYLKIAKKAFTNTPTMTRDELLSYVLEYAKGN